MKFEDLKFDTSEEYPYGIRCHIEFDNGWGASIIRNEMSYGGRDGLYEIAVLDSDGNISYDTEVTDDVIGYLEEEEVISVLEKIKQLDKQ